MRHGEPATMAGQTNSEEQTMDATDTLIRGCENRKVAEQRAGEVVADLLGDGTSYDWWYRITALLADALGAVAARGGGFTDLHAALLSWPTEDPVEVCVQAAALAAVALHAVYE